MSQQENSIEQSKLKSMNDELVKENEETKKKMVQKRGY